MKPIIVIAGGVSVAIALDQPDAIPLLAIIWIAGFILAIGERVAQRRP